MGNLYIAERFSLHMLNDIVLLKRDGAVVVTPVALSEAKNILSTYPRQRVWCLRGREVGELLDYEFDEDDVVANIRLAEGDVLIVALRHGGNGSFKLYKVSYR